MLNIIGKLLLICLLSACILLVGLTGFGLYTGLSVSPLMLGLHAGGGTLFILLVLIHLIQRRKKFLKLITQFNDLIFKNRYPSYCNLDRLLQTFAGVSPKVLADALQIPLPRLINELGEGRIRINDPNKTLREIVGENDEKLFSAITIVMQLRFNPNR